MKRVFYKLKYYWHVGKFKKIKTTFHDCKDKSVKERMKNQMEYHEKTALQCMIKSSK